MPDSCTFDGRRWAIDGWQRNHGCVRTNEDLGIETAWESPIDADADGADAETVSLVFEHGDRIGKVEQMDTPIPLPIVSVRDVLPALGFTPVWGAATDLDPAYVFKGGGIDICVAQVTCLYFRPEFLIGGVAADARTLTNVEQSMPLALESRDQVVARLSFAVDPGARARPKARQPPGTTG